MLNLNPSKVRQELQEAQAEIDRARIEIEETEKEKRRLNNNLREARRKLSQAQRNEQVLRAASIATGDIVEGLEDVLCMRDKILKNLKKVERKDILVSTREKAQQEIRDFKEEIKTICPHPFVVDREGYVGSRIDDYDDRHSPQRTCVVCGFAEKGSGQIIQGQSHYPGRYSTLIEDEKRVVVKRPYKLGSIWVPLKSIVEEHFLTNQLEHLK